MLYRLLETGLNEEFLNPLIRQKDTVGYVEFLFYSGYRCCQWEMGLTEKPLLGDLGRVTCPSEISSSNLQVERSLHAGAGDQLSGRGIILRFRSLGPLTIWVCLGLRDVLES